MLIDFLSKSCNTHTTKHKMLIGFWAVHAILAQNMHPELKGKKKVEKQEVGK